MYHAAALYIKHGGFMHIRIAPQLIGRLPLVAGTASKQETWMACLSVEAKVSGLNTLLYAGKSQKGGRKPKKAETETFVQTVTLTVFQQVQRTQPHQKTTRPKK